MKKYIPVIVVLWCIGLLSSCGTTSSAPATISGEASAMDEFRNSQPQKRADIMGTVKSITGNDFTVEVIDTSSDPIFKQMQDPDFRTKMQAMSDGERQAFMTKIQEARASAKRIMVDVTIPVGVPVLVRTGGGGGGFAGWRGWFGGGRPSTGLGASLGWQNTNAPKTPNSKQWTITDIKVGSNVNIWLAENTWDRKIASWVSTSAGQAGNNTNGGGAFGGGQPPVGR